MVLTFDVSGAAFFVILPLGYPAAKASTTMYIAWCSIMIAEAVGVLIISGVWDRLSFTKTHPWILTLFTVFGFGEDAIGVVSLLGVTVRNGGCDDGLLLTIMSNIALLAGCHVCHLNPDGITPDPLLNLIMFIILLLAGLLLIILWPSATYFSIAQILI